jgi:hypothetical protein
LELKSKKTIRQLGKAGARGVRAAVMSAVVAWVSGPLLCQADFLACGLDQAPQAIMSDPRLERVVQQLTSAFPPLQQAVVQVYPHRATTAFSRKPNQIIVTSGLLSLVRSDDELAFVVGHEMGHLQAAADAALTGGVVHEEIQADLFAISLARAGGYDPTAGARLMGRIGPPLAPRLTTMRIHLLQHQITPGS